MTGFLVAVTLAALTITAWVVATMRTTVADTVIAVALSGLTIVLAGSAVFLP